MDWRGVVTRVDIAASDHNAGIGGIAVARQVEQVDEAVLFHFIEGGSLCCQMVAEIKNKGPNPMQRPWKMWQKTIGEWKPQALRTPMEEQT